MFSFKSIIAIAALIAMVIGAVTVLATVHQSKGTMVLLLGQSGSEKGAEASIRDCASAAIDEAVHDGMTIYVAPVGRAPSATWGVVETALSSAARSNGRRADSERGRARARAQARVLRVLAAAPPAGASDLLAGTSFAGRLLAQIDDGRRKVLVACADAHQVSPTLNVYRDRLTASAVAQVLRRIHDELPDLSGVDVVFGAVGLDDKGPVTPAREAAIQAFWTGRWAAAVHARRMAYDSVPHF
jgi:hypothetical protein